LLKIIIKLIAALPLPVLYSFSRPLYVLLFYIIRFKRDIAKNNIYNSFPTLDPEEKYKLLKAHYKNYSEVVFEIIKSFNMKPEEILEHVEFENTEEIEKHLQQEQTVLLTLAHQSNLEWAILAVNQKLNFPLENIYKPLHKQWANELTIEESERFNITLMPAKTCVTELIKRTKQTRIVAITPDQAPRRRDDAYWTTFLNQQTPFYLGLEKIATLFKYPVFFLQFERIKRGQYKAKFKLLCAPPYEKDSNVVLKEYVSAVEEQIHKQPQDWLWTHKRWKKKKSLYD